MNDSDSPFSFWAAFIQVLYCVFMRASVWLSLGFDKGDGASTFRVDKY